MSEDCLFLNPLRRDGSSQRQRLTEALAPSWVQVDERELSDLLLYGRKYARLLRYYSPDGSPGGDWTELVDSDPSTLVAAVAETDPEKLRKAFEDAFDAVAVAAPKEAAFVALFPPILDLAETFESWYRKSTEGLALRRALERLLGAVLADALRGVAAAALRAAELGLPVETIDTGEWSEAWALSGAESDPSLFPSGAPVRDEEVALAAERLAQSFERLYEALVFLVGEAPAFLEETLTDYPEHPPHMALLLAFLQLLEHARDHLNTLTEAHLDFYYREVLGLTTRAAEPDQVHQLFELAKSFKTHTLAEDTFLKAGKDSTGVDLLYATDSELVVNRAVLDEDHGLKTVFVEKDTDGVVVNVYAAPDADSADGEGAAIEDEDGKWETFGGTSMPDAEIGFAVASPMFLLAEGTRTITLTFRLLAESPGTLAGPGVETELKDNVKVYASGKKEWLSLEVEGAEVRRANSLRPILVYTLKLEAGEDGVVAYDDEILLDGFKTPYPVLKLVLESSKSCPYKYFEGLSIRKLGITVQVEGLRNLILENDVGVLNPAKPFLPFGPIPKKGSSFLVGSPEVFPKSVTSLDLTIEWADLPEESFVSHYAAYKTLDSSVPPVEVPIVTGNDYFQAAYSVLQDGEWVEEASWDDDAVRRLFDGNSAEAPKSRPTLSLPLTALPRDTEPEGFESFDPTLRQGFLRATLKQSFLHGLYPKLLAKAAIGQGDVPNPPYTPLMASFTLGYTAKLGKAEDSTEQIFQIGPFGHRSLVPTGARLVPEFPVTVKDDDGTTRTETAEGTLLIGLDGLVPPQNLTLLFQVAEGSEDPLATAKEVVWSYLADEEWVDFKTSEVLSDTTQGLIASGIVKLAVPKEMTAAKTVLPSSLYWIKASVAENSKAVPKLIGVHPQAVVASFRDQGNDPSHLATALAAGRIAKMKSREAAVKSLTQLYASFGGRTQESGDAFYVRVSERLRHRGRAVTVFDYERLVLESFPEVYKVRCVNHTRTGCEHAPGHVVLVAVPNLRNKNAVDPLKPRLSLAKLEEIRELLAEISCDFVDLEVKNPEYEEVRVSFNVRFHTGYDKGLYTQQLDRDIVGYLSPWLNDDAADIAFGGRIHRSAILNYVEERPYVDFVTDFKMDHLVAPDDVRKDVEEAVATRSAAALVSAQAHTVGDDVVSCEDTEA